MTRTDVNESLKTAAKHFANGEMEKADYACRRILQHDPKNADALHLLALVSIRLNKLTEAVSFLNKACECSPNNPEFLSNLGNVTKFVGDKLKARRYYEQAIAADSTFLPAFYNLALLLTEQGDLAEAATLYKRALLVDNCVAELHYSLATVLRALEQRREAIACCREALRINPQFFEAQIVLGNLFYEENNLLEALIAYEDATKINSQSAIAFNGIGLCQTALGDYLSAKQALLKAIALAPEMPQLHNNLAVAYLMTGEYDKATMSLDRSVSLDANQPEAFRNYGNVLAAQKQYTEAIIFYRKALQLEPNFYEAKVELAIALKECGDTSAAKEAFEQAQKMNPGALAPRCGLLGASLPSFYWHESEIDVSRVDYAMRFNELENYLASNTCDLREAEEALTLVRPYYLSYQGRNDIDLHRQYGQLLYMIVSARYPQWSKGKAKRTIHPGEKIRLGIVSSNFNNHADWKMITSGIVNNINRDHFSLFAYSTGGITDEITEMIGAKTDHFYRGLSFSRLCQQIDQDNIDILLFPELGMDPTAMKIACLRLASVQCCAWGKTDTSGLPTMDYFISAQAMEPADAQSHYSEKLVLLPGLGSYCQPTLLPKINRTQEIVGLRKTATKFLCIQSLVKYMPQFDFVFTDIAKKVPNAQFLFVARPDGIATKFLERLTKAFAQENLAASDYVTMLPFMDRFQLAKLCDSADIFLDSINFSGCVTALDAIEHSIPIVTVRGAMMRERQCAAMLDIIGLQELVADNAEEYVQKAAKLALDTEYRTAISHKISAHRDKLYENKSVITSLEKAFKRFLA